MLRITLIFHDDGILRRRSGINEEFDCSTQKEIEAALRYGFAARKLQKQEERALTQTRKWKETGQCSEH
jgi:hypothetical protein